MCKKLKNGFNLVYNQKLLKRVIKFLEEGYKWDSKTSINLYRYLKRQKFNIPKAAVYAHNGNITIGILLFHQGWSKLEKKNIINFSSWYADTTFRGIEALIFAKNLTFSLNRYLITNYTANPSVCKILKVLKYSDMSVKKETIGLSKMFPFVNLGSFLNFVTFKIKLKKPKDIKNKKSRNKTNDLFYKIHKIKKFGIVFSDLSIYSSNYNFKVSLFWLLIMIMRFKVLRVKFYSKKDNKPSLNVWLIKNSNKENYILPTGSELLI